MQGFRVHNVALSPVRSARPRALERQPGPARISALRPIAARSMLLYPSAGLGGRHVGIAGRWTRGKSRTPVLSMDDRRDHRVHRAGLFAFVFPETIVSGRARAR